MFNQLCYIEDDELLAKWEAAYRRIKYTPLKDIILEQTEHSICQQAEELLDECWKCTAEVLRRVIQTQKEHFGELEPDEFLYCWKPEAVGDLITCLSTGYGNDIFLTEFEQEAWLSAAEVVSLEFED